MCIKATKQRLYLAGSRPHVLQNTLLSGQAVDRVVSLAHTSNTAAQDDSLVLAGDSLALSVQLGNVDLDAGVVLGGDDGTGGVALAGSVQVGLEHGSGNSGGHLLVVCLEKICQGPRFTAYTYQCCIDRAYICKCI